MIFYGVSDPNHQLLAVGWEEGVLRLRWGKGQQGEHTGVPEDLYMKLRRVPFAYNQYQKTIKGKFPYRKVEERDGISGVDVQDTAGRVCDSGLASVSELDGGPDRNIPGDGKAMLPHGRRDAQGAGGRIMDIYFPADGMQFHSEDAKGNPAHYYSLNGVRIPFSLTQIIELAGLSRQPGSAQESEAWVEKAKLGTKVHEYTLWADQGELELDDLKNYPAYYNRVLGWKQFREDFKFEPDMLRCEVPVGVRVNGMLYGMMVDAFGHMGEVNAPDQCLAVVEKKTTCNIESSVALQTAGQALAFKGVSETSGLPLKRYVVQLLAEPNGSGRCYKAQEFTDRNDEKLFVGAGLMNCYYRLNTGLLKER